MSRIAGMPKPLRLRRNPSVATRPRTAIVVSARNADPISHDTRIFVWQRDGGRCRNCGSRRDLHFDHVVPRAWGGASVAANVELLCRDCNLRKGARLAPPPHDQIGSDAR
ncbi:HNH endonuclease [bacterium]|nr:HNH endonuclease [bacterium]